GMYTAFQSTLPQGERRFCDWIRYRRSDFNPRSRKGSDVTQLGDAKTETDISIHAPARGATTMSHLQSVSQKFQSTLPQGERQDLSWIYTAENIFQSTLPQGERRWWCV